MNGKVNRAEAHQNEGGLIQLYHVKDRKATSQLHFDTLQLVVAEQRSRPAGMRGASFVKKALVTAQIKYKPLKRYHLQAP